MKILPRIAIMCVGIMLLFAFAAVLAPPAPASVWIEIDERPLKCDVQPYIVAGKTMVPADEIFGAMSMSVFTDKENQSLTAKGLGLTIDVKTGNKTASVNNKVMQMDVEPTLKNGKIMIPVTFVRDACSYAIRWIQNDLTIKIFTNSELFNNGVERTESFKADFFATANKNYKSMLMVATENSNGDLTQIDIAKSQLAVSKIYKNQSFALPIIINGLTVEPDVSLNLKIISPTGKIVHNYDKAVSELFVREDSLVGLCTEFGNISLSGEAGIYSIMVTVRNNEKSLIDTLIFDIETVNFEMQKTFEDVPSAVDFIKNYYKNPDIERLAGAFSLLSEVIAQPPEDGTLPINIDTMREFFKESISGETFIYEAVYNDVTEKWGDNDIPEPLLTLLDEMNAELALLQERDISERNEFVDLTSAEQIPQWEAEYYITGSKELFFEIVPFLGLYNEPEKQPSNLRRDAYNKLRETNNATYEAAKLKIGELAALDPNAAEYLREIIEHVELKEDVKIQMEEIAASIPH